MVLQVQAQPSLLHKQLDLPHDALVLTAAASSQAGVAISGAEDQLIRVRTHGDTRVGRSLKETHGWASLLRRHTVDQSLKVTHGGPVS